MPLSTYLPPMHNWTGYPFYVCGLAGEYAFLDANEETPGFPVEIASDYSKITIKPIVAGGQNCYMNAVGVSGGSLELVATVISEIVLTKGWTETRSASDMTFAAVPSKVNAVTVDGAPVAELAFSEKMRAHQLIPELSSYKQKFSAGTYGAVVLRPFAIQIMTGV